MIDKLLFKNNQNAIVDFYGTGIAVTDYNVTPHHRIADARPRMQSHGEWKTRTYRGGFTIDIQGDLMADNSSAYYTLRQSVVNGLYSNPDLITDRRDGFLIIKETGATEDWSTEVRIEAFTAPRTVTGSGPARTAFMLTLFSFSAYFTGVATGRKYYDA